MPFGKSCAMFVSITGRVLGALFAIEFGDTSASRCTIRRAPFGLMYAQPLAIPETPCRVILCLSFFAPRHFVRITRLHGLRK